MESYKIASAIRGIIAQRLLRRLCPVCKETMDGPLPSYMNRYIPEGSILYKPVGCKECANTGYRGRFAITEILTASPELEGLISTGGTADKIAEIARRQGMRTLFESGLRHMLRGQTSVEELLRVTDIPSEHLFRDRPVAKEGTATAAPPRPGAPPPSVPVSHTATDQGDINWELIDEPLDLSDPDEGRGTVLLVEDEDQLRRVMKDLLERDGYTIVEAADGVQALEQVDRHNPDVILLDLNLPGMDGYGVLSQLRSRPSTATTPVIVLTAKGDEDNEVRVLKLGADDFLTKPFRARALSARLESVISRRRSAR
jgi:CheY-like chemotaxis protein